MKRMSNVVKLCNNLIDTQSEENDILSRASTSGAMVNFRGTVRPNTKQGEPLDCLILNIHPVMTLKSMKDITSRACDKFDVDHCQVIHRYGKITPTETIVYVVIASQHRREAFLAADFIMDHLKSTAVFWKKEEGSFGSRWIEPTDRDASDLIRWQ